MMILSLVRNYIPSYQWGFALTSRCGLQKFETAPIVMVREYGL
jgi:hypothetical protein